VLKTSRDPQEWARDLPRGRDPPAGKHWFKGKFLLLECVVTCAHVLNALRMHEQLAQVPERGIN